MAKLRHIAMWVPDPQRSAKFYCEALGMKVVGEANSATATGVYLSDGTISLALLKYRTDQAAGERGKDYVGVHHIGFLVDDARRAEPAGREQRRPDLPGRPAREDDRVLREEIPRPGRHHLQHDPLRLEGHREIAVEEMLEWGRKVLASQPFSVLLRAERVAFSPGSAKLRIPISPS